MPRLLISAAHKSSGKTTISIGLCAALRARGQLVQPFKKGPDYIDPMWLSLASGRACRNLDPWLSGRGEIVAAFENAARGADFSLVEGNKGLYDGLALDGSNSNAALAQMLGLPVVLVIDARGMTRGIAPLILGYQAFDRGIRIAGVILNNLGGARHEAKLRAVIEHYTEIPVLGAVHCDSRLQIVERHLGLMPSNEAAGALPLIAVIGESIARQVDLDRVTAIAAGAASLGPVPAGSAGARRAATAGKIRIGIARDRAFAFYYADDLDAFAQEGAELVPFDTLRDRGLPQVDGLFIGGGFPEAVMSALEANRSLREDIRSKIDAGMPAYAECGGLMYLARSLTWNGRTCNMVGAIPGDVVMHEKPVGRGYVELEETSFQLWPAEQESPKEVFRGHEFHYSSLENLDRAVQCAYRVRRGHGVDGRHDGVVVRNLVASYAHLRSTGNCRWVARFVRYVRSKRAARKMPAAGAGRAHALAG